MLADARSRLLIMMPVPFYRLFWLVSHKSFTQFLLTIDEEKKLENVLVKISTLVRVVVNKNSSTKHNG